MRLLLNFIMSACLLMGCNQKEEFKPLFNGQDLSGWVNVNGDASTWVVRDQMIVCSGIPTGVLRTTQQYENFVLEVEWKHLHKDGNAGLFIHADALPAPGKPLPAQLNARSWTEIMEMYLLSTEPPYNLTVLIRRAGCVHYLRKNELIRPENGTTTG
jgi:hypothetical protein